MQQATLISSYLFEVTLADTELCDARNKYSQVADKLNVAELVPKDLNVLVKLIGVRISRRYHYLEIRFRQLHEGNRKTNLFLSEFIQSYKHFLKRHTTN